MEPARIEADRLVVIAHQKADGPDRLLHRSGGKAAGHPLKGDHGAPVPRGRTDRKDPLEEAVVDLRRTISVRTIHIDDVPRQGRVLARTERKLGALQGRRAGLPDQEDRVEEIGVNRPPSEEWVRGNGRRHRLGRPHGHRDLEPARLKDRPLDGGRMPRRTGLGRPEHDAPLWSTSPRLESQPLIIPLRLAILTGRAPPTLVRG